MTPTILTETHYDAVRGLISPDVTDAQIPDAYLSQLPFAPTAEKEIRKRLAIEGINVDTLNADMIDDARLAMMHTCAAVLCLTAPQLIRQSALQVSTEMQRIDWQEKRQFHLTEAERKINEITSNFGEMQKDSTVSRYVPFRAIG